MDSLGTLMVHTVYPPLVSLATQRTTTYNSAFRFLPHVFVFVLSQYLPPQLSLDSKVTGLTLTRGVLASSTRCGLVYSIICLSLV